MESEVVAKEPACKITFERRMKGLKKKTFEFSTLCGVDACLINLEPNQSEPKTLPENHQEVLNIINKFRKKGIYGAGEHQVPQVSYLGDDRINSFSIDQLKNLKLQLVKLIIDIEEQNELDDLTSGLVDLREGNMLPIYNTQEEPEMNEFNLRDYHHNSSCFAPHLCQTLDATFPYLATHPQDF